MNDAPVYWTDPDLTDTDAAVTSSRPSSLTDMGDAWEVVLDRSPFFPGGGGQAPDEGRIAGRRILDVRREDGNPVFLLEGAEPISAGSVVRCIVDPVRRRRSRQTHSGQHLISAALAAEGLDTLSVHLGMEYCGIEVNADSVDASVIGRVLDTCDRIIGDDRPVESLLLSPAELEKISLRRPLRSKSGGMDSGEEEEGLNGAGSRSTIRVVTILGFDAVGCGGVHLSRTSGIRLVLFDGSERIRGRLRLRWLIGDEAVRRCRILAEQARELTGLLSVPLDGLAGRAGDLTAELREVKGRCEASEREIGRLLVETSRPETIGPAGAETVCLAVGGGAVRLEGALEAVRGSGVKTAFLLGSPGADGEAPWVLYHSGGEEFFLAVKDRFLPEVKGKGGGRPPVMRGRLACAPEEALVRFRALQA